MVEGNQTQVGAVVGGGGGIGKRFMQGLNRLSFDKEQMLTGRGTKTDNM